MRAKIRILVGKAGDLCFVSIQKSYPTHRHGYRTEILLNLALENIGAHLIQYVAELIVYLWKKHGFIEAGGIFKGYEFHRLPISGMHCLAGYQPPNGGYCFTHMGVEIISPHIVYVPQDPLIALKGMVGEGKTQGFQLMFQHETFWVRRLFYRELGGRWGEEGRGIFLLMLLTKELKGLPH